MPSYTAPVKDMMFLYDKLRDNKYYNELEKYNEVNSDLVKDILEEAAKINQNLILPLAKVAFELAGKRKNKVTSCEKSNVMEAGQLWKEEVQALHEKEYKDVELSHMLADNCAMQLLRNPKQFDVIVTDNLFGDMLSDQASMLTGSLGLLP